MGLVRAQRPIRIEATHTRFSGIDRYHANNIATISVGPPNDDPLVPKEMLNGGSREERRHQLDSDKTIELQNSWITQESGRYDYIIESLREKRRENARCRIAKGDWTLDEIEETIGSREDFKSRNEISLDCAEARNMNNFETFEDRCFFPIDASEEPQPSVHREIGSPEAKSLERRSGFPTSRTHPYARTERSPRIDRAAEALETAANRILEVPEYCDMLSPCLDILFSPDNSPGSPDRGVSTSEVQQAPLPPVSAAEAGSILADAWKNIGNEAAFPPSIRIVRVEPRPAQTYSEGTSRYWPEFLSDSREQHSAVVAAVSNPSSRCSSRPQSPCLGRTVGSPLTMIGRDASPIGSPQVAQTAVSPCSSTYSYGDNPSPQGYRDAMSQPREDQLCKGFEDINVWSQPYAVPSCPTSLPTATDPQLGALDPRDDLQELLNGSANLVNDSSVPAPASAPAPPIEANATWISDMQYEDIDVTLNPILWNPLPNGRPFENSTSNNTVYTIEDKNLTYRSNSIDHGAANDYAANPHDRLYDSMVNGQFNFSGGTSGSMLSNVQPSLEPSTSSIIPRLNHVYDQLPIGQTILPSRRVEPSRSNPYKRDDRSVRVTPLSVIGDLRLPQPILKLPSRKQDSVPWPVMLNLSAIKDSERLQEGLNPEEVKKAMAELLGKKVDVLARPDEDGDTKLMCLVGNPDELMSKRAYLAPLVERLGNKEGALSYVNNRGEDALYLAAVNCPKMPYVTGYLAEAMLQRRIDIGQTLYRGNTLIHAIAARGDSHREVLEKLLALRTPHGHSVFDLSKRNYDGRTALHVAVEAHDPSGTSGISATTTVRLLLENGADPRMTAPNAGNTALHMAASLSCDPALVQVLLRKSSLELVNATNLYSNTPLHMAAAVSNNVSLDRHRDVCRLLIEAGARSNIPNCQGKTPLTLVAPERKEILRRVFYEKL